ncbi:MAG: zinc-ribbon domain-containing protein [Lentisphaeria bacterium]|nr:zinc-ribbon domain-containing protein [Lentisphaeria bacterium]
MDKKQIPTYLANVLSVARADNVIADSEQVALDTLCAEIGAKKTDLKKAEKLVASTDFVPQPVGRFSDRVRNVEDMIFVSLMDGDLGEAETAIIVSFIKKTELNQEIVDGLMAEGQARVDAICDTTCSSCGSEITASAKFCPSCGAQLGAVLPQEDGVQIEFNYPTSGISIEFAESSSANFDTALDSARSAPNFQMCEKSGKKWYLATWPEEQIADVLGLVDNLKGLRNRKIYINGEPAQWDEAFAFDWCFQKQQQAYKPAEYCFGVDEDRLNVWGCRQAKMDWTSWAKWFAYGKFRKKDIFVFDKDRIRHELETNLYKVRFCPCLRPDLISTVLDILPNEVRVSERLGWSYKREYEEGPQSMKVVVKQVQDEYTYKDEFWTSGVSPVGCVIALDILKKAFKQCGIRDVTPKMLATK